jgi:hypothetical protein
MRALIELIREALAIGLTAASFAMLVVDGFGWSVFLMGCAMVFGFKVE